MALGENIKSRREALKLSQEYIAEQLGVSRQAVSKWETGQSERIRITRNFRPRKTGALKKDITLFCVRT